MGIQKKALETAAGTSKVSSFSTKPYMGGQTTTTIPFDKFPRTRNVVVDVAPWLFVAHLHHGHTAAATTTAGTDSAAAKLSLPSLRRSVLVPEIWAAVMVARATFITLPCEIAAALAGEPTGRTRVALMFDNDCSVPGSGRKYVEHIYRDLHNQPGTKVSAVRAAPEDFDCDGGDDDGGGCDDAGSAHPDTESVDTTEPTASVPEDDVDTAIPSSGAEAATVCVDWDEFLRYTTQPSETSAAPFVRGVIPPKASKRSQRYDFYASVVAVLESGRVPPMAGQLLVDDGRDEVYRRISEGCAVQPSQAYARVRHVAATPGHIAHLTVTWHETAIDSPLSAETPGDGGAEVRLNCYGILHALHRQRLALISLIDPLVSQGEITPEAAVQLVTANLHTVAAMFKTLLGLETCAALADAAARGAFAWTESGSGGGMCIEAPRGAPRCAEGERLALVFLREWMAESASGAQGNRSVFMCEDSDGPALALMLLAPQICEQHLDMMHPARGPRNMLAIMRYRQGTFHEMDYSLMAECIATQLTGALYAGLRRFDQHQDKRAAASSQRGRHRPAVHAEVRQEALWRRGKELAAMVAAMLFFVGSDYVQDVRRLVPDFPVSIHPGRLTRAILRCVTMVAEFTGPPVLRSDHVLYVSPHTSRAPLLPETGDGARGLSPVMCALVMAIMLAEEQVHGSRARCGDKNTGVVLRRDPPSGRRRRRPAVMSPGSMILCRREMRLVRRLFPTLVGCSPAECGLLAPQQGSRKTKKTKASTGRAGEKAAERAHPLPCVRARALIYACPHARSATPTANGTSGPDLQSPLASSHVATNGGSDAQEAPKPGKRKREADTGGPSAKRAKHAPTPMPVSTILATKFAVYEEFAAAVGAVPGVAATAHRFAAAAAATGKRPAKKRLEDLSSARRAALAGVVRGQLARLVCEDWTLHAYTREQRVLDCTARTASGESAYGYALCAEPATDTAVPSGDGVTRVRERMVLTWPQKLILDPAAMDCVRACLRGYRDVGY